MANVPTTKISLLTAISKDANCARWAEFVRVYESPMRGFLFAKYPSLEADDVIQETLLALVKALPNYHYTPDTNGHFRNYLMGILNHKACDMLHRRVRESEKRTNFRNKNPRNRVDPQIVANEEEAEKQFRESLMQSALDQLLTDDAINPTHREIFRHVAVLHESPADVARQFNVTRNNVDQIKNRLVKRLAEMVTAMEA